MKILIVSATLLEVKPLVDRFDTMTLLPDILHKFRYNDLEIDLLTPGIGMVPTAFYLGKYLTDGNYKFAINAGICGTYNPEIPPGTVVHVVEECIPEAGVESEGKFRSFYSLGLQDPEEYPFDEGKLVNDNYPEYDTIESLRAVKGNSVYTMQTDPERIARLLKQFPADVESMEGASFLYACLVDNMACAQIRAVSNIVGERDKKKWKVNQALKNLDAVLMNLIEETEKRLLQDEEEDDEEEYL